MEFGDREYLEYKSKRCMQSFDEVKRQEERNHKLLMEMLKKDMEPMVKFTPSGHKGFFVKES